MDSNSRIQLKKLTQKGWNPTQVNSIQVKHLAPQIPQNTVKNIITDHWEL